MEAIFSIAIVYSKSTAQLGHTKPGYKRRAVLHRKTQRAYTNTRAAGSVLILDIRKGGYYKQQVSQKHRCNDNRRNLPHGSQPWRTRQPQVYGGQQFPTGCADHSGYSAAGRLSDASTLCCGSVDAMRRIIFAFFVLAKLEMPCSSVCAKKAFILFCSWGFIVDRLW